MDEPTTGVDPESRCELWDVLLDLRRNHSILLTTQLMEEAEALADHVFIMSHGKILCAGTTEYLKLKYGSGYELKLECDVGVDLQAVMRIVVGFIRHASIKVNH